jgi:hypothetical protein
MLYHPRPLHLVIVGTIDAHAVHTLLEKIINEIVVLSRLARHGHHDADHASKGCDSEKGIGMFSQPTLAFNESYTCFLCGLIGTTRQAVENCQNRIQRGKHMGFRSPQGGKP